MLCCKGATPIEKNFIVTDVNGKIIGSTYPKRARGLVKNGRAEYAGDHTIRLKNTHVPAVNNITEEIKMSKVIDFNAREFRFDETCRSLDGDEVNAGMRAFVTMSFGNTEVWEIGDWCWTWSQIRCDLKLEKNTDYVFRFAMEGGVCDTDDAVTIAHITPRDNWEQRYSYLLDHNKFMPVICKKDGDGLLRIFELPFNTGDDEEWIIYLVAQHAVARFFAPVSAEITDSLPDITYSDWWNEGREKKRQAQSGFNAVDGINVAYESQEIDEAELADSLTKIGDNCSVAFENVTVRFSGAEGDFSVGSSVDGSNFAFENCTLTSRAMSMILAKLGDGCNVGMENITVTEEGIDDLIDIGGAAFGMNIALDNVTIPAKVFRLFNAKLGDGSNMASENVTTVNKQNDPE